MSVIERLRARLDALAYGVSTVAHVPFLTPADLRALLAVVEAADSACRRLEGFAGGSWEDSIARPLRAAIAALEAPNE